MIKNADDQNFKHLGQDFQESLIKTILEDKKFGSTIIDVLDSKYFDGQYFKYFIQNIKEIHGNLKRIPDYLSLEYKIRNENSKDTSYQVLIDTLQNLKEKEIPDLEYVQRIALNFCRQQVLKKAIKDAEVIMNSGNFELYPKIEEIFQQALQVGANTDEIVDATDDVRFSLENDNRVPFPLGIKGLDNLLKGGLARGELGVILAALGVGKELPVSEPLLTPNGWKPIGEAKVGDEVIGSDGKSQYVLGVYPQGIKPIYKIEFTDNTFVNCGLEHLWSVNTANMRKASTMEYIVLKTSDMIDNIKKLGVYNYRLPIINPVEFSKKNLLIDPYLLGLLLGNGQLPINNTVGVSTKDDELYIPKDYLYTSLDDRIKLLQGLMDIDGYVSKTGKVQIITVSEQLSKDIRELVLSLGGAVSIKGERKKGQLTYIVTMSFSYNIVPFQLIRKLGRYYKKVNFNNQKFVKAITYSHDEEAVCIKISNPDELFVTRDYVLTHNTTLATKIANSGFNTGANVLQIFFEDNIKDIRKKHFTAWTGISPDDLKANIDEVERVIKEKEKQKNFLKLLKMPSVGTTVSDIKSKIRKLKSEGHNVDLLIIDYVDCIASEKAMDGGDEWKGEALIMRHLESMTSEFDMAIWVCTQGSRDAIDIEVVTSNKMGGSIKKGQIGHVIISVGKTLEQKEHKLATVSLLKSRIGNDGVIFQNCTFDNEYLVIDTEKQNTLLGYIEEKEEKKSKRAHDVYKLEQENKKNNI